MSVIWTRFYFSYEKKQNHDAVSIFTGESSGDIRTRHSPGKVQTEWCFPEAGRMNTGPPLWRT